MGPTSHGALTWRSLRASDLPMLAAWLGEPQVARWWNHETSPAAVERDFGPSTRGEEPGEDLVVSLDGRPIGLLQRSVIADYPEDLEEFAALAEVPAGAIELDYLIADPSLRGRGLGSRMIARAIDDTWTAYPDAPAVLVAVVAANVASWRALEKAGLRRIAEGEMSPENPRDDPLHFVYRVDRPAAQRDGRPAP
jgi:aminoglycoside 6'-N-acetyltransferase